MGFQITLFLTLAVYTTEFQQQLPVWSEHGQTPKLALTVIMSILGKRVKHSSSIYLRGKIPQKYTVYYVLLTVEQYFSQWIVLLGYSVWSHYLSSWRRTGLQAGSLGLFFLCSYGKIFTICKFWNARLCHSRFS